MNRKLECILLIDDDEEDNFFHKLVIERMNITNCIVVALNGLEALEYLRKEDQLIPELIFLDINMPKMNGWEFLEEYKLLEESQKAKMTVMMLTTSVNPDDVEKAKEIGEVTGYQTKPLSQETLARILDTYFEQNS